MRIKNSDSFLETVAMTIFRNGRKHANDKRLNVSRELGRIFLMRKLVSLRRCAGQPVNNR